MPGKVYLVGGGPGDPDLITLKGKRALEQADLVLYDNLSPEPLLSMAPAHAEKVYVGKKRAAHSFSQEEICAMLVRAANAGRTVVRLKGGDPYLFGRGGEEAEVLADAGLAFEVIPGVTSAAGVAAYAGIPLTHRDHTSVVRVVTGHDAEQIDWRGLAAHETLVILMGLVGFDGIAKRMLDAGWPPQTPAAAVRWATRADQRSVVSTLAGLASAIASAQLKPPATVVVGEVVRLSTKLNWFERLPLFGRRIVVTRALAQSAGMARALRDLGAEPIVCPAIEIGPPSDFAPLDAAIEQLHAWDWLVFTSANGVRMFLERLDGSPIDLRRLRAKIAAIGPATAQALEAAHLKIDLTGDQFVAESLLDAFDRHDLSGRQVLLVRAAEARELLPDQLRARGATVDVVAAYRTQPASTLAHFRALFAANPPDWITFTSSSTVRHFFAAIPRGALTRSRIASIGPVTSETLREMGIHPNAEAAVFTTEGVIQAILDEPAAGASELPFP